MSLREKLKSEIEQADWDMLKAHHERGAIFIIKGPLELEIVGEALGEDKVDLVKIWLDNGDFYKLESGEQWEKEPNQKIGKFVIVQPYIILKLD